MNENDPESAEQLAALRQNAQASLAALKVQQQQQLEQALAQMQALQCPADSQAGPNPEPDTQTEAATFDGMLIKERLLDPQQGMDKIRSVQSEQMQRLITKIKGTLASGPAADILSDKESNQ